MFFISCFTVSVTLPINTPESSNDLVILIISFKIKKVNSIPVSTVPFRFIFLSNLSIAFEVKLLTCPGKLALIKGIATFVSAFLPKLEKIDLID